MKKIIAINGPRGVGKDSVLAELLKRYPDQFTRILTYCSREPRPGEIHGKTYNFVDNKTFQDKLESGDIFEYTQYQNTYRGMSKSIIDDILKTGKIAIGHPDVIGLRALRSIYPDIVLGIFLTIDKGLLQKRLESIRAHDIQARLEDYETSCGYAKEFDVVISNDGTLEELVTKVYNIIKENI